MDRKDEQPMRNLAAHIRDTGMPPGRDLWPQISAAIDRQEAMGTAPGPHRVRGGWRGVAALAACLLVAVGVGWSVLPRLRAAAEPAPSSLAVVDGAIAQLQAAMRDDPDNGNLSHLLRTLHRSRSQLLIRTAESRARTSVQTSTETS